VAGNRCQKGVYASVLKETEAIRVQFREPLFAATSATRVSDHLRPPPTTATTQRRTRTQTPYVMHLSSPSRHSLVFLLATVAATTLLYRCNHAPPATIAASPPLLLHLHFVHLHFVHGFLVHLLLSFFDNCRIAVRPR